MIEMNDKVQGFQDDLAGIVVGGLTKREHFAAMALQGLCGNAVAGKPADPPFFAEEAVKYADALISELNKQPK